MTDTSRPPEAQELPPEDHVSSAGSEDSTPSPAEPSLAALIGANMKLLACVGLGMIAAFYLWRGLAELFPDYTWLQLPS